MDKLKSLDSIVVRQKKEWGEILTGFEQKNKYSVMDGEGNEMYFAAEDGGSFLSRMFLKALRPFQIGVYNLDGAEMMRIRRPFKFLFHECEAFDASGTSLGKIKWEFAIIRKKYAVLDPNGVELFKLFGPALKPWTFKIMKGEQEVGVITKKWSGLLQEGFTDADNFGVQFPREWDVKTKALFLSAVFLIDFVHFENKN